MRNSYALVPFLLSHFFLTAGANLMAASLTAQDIIVQLKLEPLPGEGGYFRETYRSDQQVGVGDKIGSERSASTAIYYLVTPNEFSKLHRLPVDEVFHFYAGDPVEMLQIHPDGKHELILLGNDLSAGQRPQVIVKAGVWQGTRLKNQESDFALLGTTVAPGFEFSDLEVGDRQELVESYPNLKEIIERYTE